MIDGRSNINSYSSVTHEHNVTKCLHEEQIQKPEGSTGGAGDTAAKEQSAEKQQKLSVMEVLVGGLQNMRDKTTGLLKRIWYSDNAETVNTNETVNVNEKAASSETAMNFSAGILATGAVKPAGAEKVSGQEQLLSEEEFGRRIGNIEGAVSGGLRKEQGGIKKFLKQFSEMVFGTGRLSKKKNNAENALSKNNTDLKMESSSYLLDSYNRSGEYSTLAKDQSLEGNFKARG